MTRWSGSRARSRPLGACRDRSPLWGVGGVLLAPWLLAGAWACGGVGGAGPGEEADVGLDDAVPEDAGGGDAAGDDAGDGARADLDAPGEPDADPEPPGGFVPPGPFHVGYRQIEASYVPVGGQEARDLRVALWYPTLQTEGGRTRYRNLLPREGVWADAEPAEGPLPVLVFSHGSSGFAEQSFFLTEHFASYGWLVVAPDHPGNTFFDGGRIAPEVFELRPQDASAALDQILALPAEDPLAGLAAEPFVAAGHSFGGYTALVLGGAAFDIEGLEAACEEGFGVDLCDYLTPEVIARIEVGYADDRFGAIIAMAPGGFAAFGAAGLAAVDVPVLQMTGGVDTFTPDAREGDPIWEALAVVPRARIALAAGGHFTFTNVCGLGIPVPDNDSCGPDNVPTDAIHPILSRYALHWAQGDLRIFEEAPLHTGLQLTFVAE